MNCAEARCGQPTAGKSKYCRTHRAVSRERWKAMVAANAAGRQARDARWALLFEQADTAGRAAAQAVTPTPMVVVQRANPLDDRSPIVRQYQPVVEGVCGFAWVTVCPGNHSFALWLKRHKGARAGYHGGIQLWISAYGQSMTRKEAYADAFAAALRVEGIRANAGSRLD